MLLQSHDTANQNYVNVGYSSGFNLGQKFQLQNDANVTSMSLFGGRGTVGSQPGTMKIEILSGSYNGTVIATTGAISNSGMSVWTSSAWHEFTFLASVNLDKDTDYYVKATALTGSSNDVFRWSVDGVTPTYPHGSAWYNNAALGAYDAQFRISGTEGGGGQNSNFLAFM